jgi:hypothetical protein
VIKWKMSVPHRKSNPSPCFSHLIDWCTRLLLYTYTCSKYRYKYILCFPFYSNLLSWFSLRGLWTTSKPVNRGPYTAVLITLLASIMLLCLKPLILETKLQINKFINTTFFWDSTGVSYTCAGEITPRSAVISYICSLYVVSGSENIS